jgi:hypothetical protein
MWTYLKVKTKHFSQIFKTITLDLFQGFNSVDLPKNEPFSQDAGQGGKELSALKGLF